MNIREIRLKQNLKQSELAEKAGISRVAIGNYERGDRNPNIEILTKIAEALNIPISKIIGENPKEIDLSSIPTKDLIEELNKRTDFKTVFEVIEN